MKLFLSLTSPYARKARVVAIENGIADQIEEVLANPLGEDMTDLLNANPLGKVPVLLLTDGRRIFDSTVICEYLASLGAASPLLPADGNERIDMQVRHALANGVIDAAFNLMVESGRPEMQRSDFWQSRWKAAIERAVKEMARSIAAGRFDLGDLTTAIALLYLDFRLPDIKWREPSQALAEWVDGQAKRPSLLMTAPLA